MTALKTNLIVIVFSSNKKMLLCQSYDSYNLVQNIAFSSLSHTCLKWNAEGIDSIEYLCKTE